MPTSMVTKSRTGCYNCKLRRIKCQEGNSAVPCQRWATITIDTSAVQAPAGVSFDEHAVETTAYGMNPEYSATMGDGRHSHGYLSVPARWPSMLNRSDQTRPTSMENGGSEMTSGVVTDNATGSPDLEANNTFADKVGQLLLNEMFNPKSFICHWTTPDLSGSSPVFTTYHRLIDDTSIEQRAAKADGCVSAGDAAYGFNSGKPGETKRADWTWDQVLPGGVHSQRYAASSKAMENISWRMWCSSSPGSSSSRGTAEIPASSCSEHGGILWEKDRSKVEDEDSSRWGLHRQPQPTWDQMGAFDVSGGMEGYPNLSRPHGDTPSSLGLPPPIKVDINGVIDKAFFLADNEWTCYRRNYFSCVPSYSMSSPGHPNTTTQFPSSSLPSLGTTLHRIFRSSPARPGRRRSLPPFLTPLLILLAASPVSAQHPALLHIAAGTSFATSATIPPLRGSSTVPAPWWIAMYATWATAFVVFLVLELRRLPDWAQQRLLLGLFIFSGLNLTGSLVQGEDSMLEGVANWGPLAMTVSLWLVPALIEFWGARGAVEMAGA